MSETARQLLVAVQALPDNEQRELADAVLDRFDELELSNGEWEEAWGPEIERRIGEMRNGTVETVTWEEIKAEWAKEPARKPSDSTHSPNSKSTRLGTVQGWSPGL